MASTTADAEFIATSRVRHGRTGRRMFVVAITGFLLLGMFNVFGVRTRTTADGAATLTYATVGRRGLPASWGLRVSVPSGAGSVRVRVPTAYLDALDITRILPEPSSEVATNDIVEWQFDRPGPAFTVSLAATIGPHVTPGRRSTVTDVLVDGRRIAHLSYRTWILP